MEWTVLCCLMLAICVSIQAEPVASSPEENRSLYPEPAALFNSGRPERQGEFLLLKDFMNQGDSLLKERLKESYSNLKEVLKEGDSVLKEQIVGGVAQVKEQLKEGDGRLKEELNEDVAWLKDRLAKGQTRMKEELAEGEAQMKEDQAEERDDFEKLKHSVKQQFKSSSALIDDLKQQMSDVQAELKSTKLQLNTTQTELRTTQVSLQSTQETLQSTQETLQSTRSDLHTTQERVKEAEDELQRTREQFQEEMEVPSALKAQLQAVEDEIHSLKNNSLRSSLQHRPLEASAMRERDFYVTGSTFIRWGRTECPDNTSIVYSGIAGGSPWNNTGGGSNYLCLVMDPQLDNTTLPPYPHFTYLLGSEYQHINGHHDQDVVCSVCRAPQATTLMIPATLTCPVGWTTQYKGHLTSAHHAHKGRTEFVCLDNIRENRDGGHENRDGAMFYLLTSRCGSLPCPPYVSGKVVTCVVCSL